MSAPGLKGPALQAPWAFRSQPPERDRFIDLLRVAAIAVVVAGHWLVLIPTVHAGLAAGRPLYQVDPRFWPLTWVFNVLPLFFFAGGFANYTSGAGGGPGGGFAVRRLRRLLLPTFAFGLVWLGLEALMQGLNLGAPGLLRGLRLGQTTPFEPLWFLAVYLAVVLTSPATIWLHRRLDWGVPVAMLAATGLSDLAAWRTGVPWLLLANLAFVWLLPHQLGYLYAEGRLQALRPRTLWLTAAGALLITAGLTSLPFYTRNLLDGSFAVLGVAAPTLPVASLSISMIAACLAARRPLERVLARPGAWALVGSANGAVMTLFLWHMTAYFAVLVALAALGMPLPPRPDAAWWLERPAFLLLPAAALLPLVRLFAPLEDAARRPGTVRRLARSA